MVEKMYFQPVLAIFADDVGNAIYDLLRSSSLLERVHEPLRQGIGLLRVLSDSRYRYHLLNTPEEQATEQATLGATLKEAFTHLDDVRRQQYIVDAQYEIQIKRPHVHIIGHVESPMMKSALDAVRDISEQRYGGISAVHISYHLCFYASDPSQSAARWTEEISDKLAKSSVNFCYLYGDDPASGFGAADYSYAVAQSLFTLMATGITAQLPFQAMNKINPEAPVFNYGTLSTSLISSPRRAVEDMCSNYVASLLLMHWLEQAVKMQTAIQPAVERDIEQIQQWLEPNGERPGTEAGHLKAAWWRRLHASKIAVPVEQHRWSDLSILEDGTPAQKDQRRRLVEHTRRLFAHTNNGRSRHKNWVTTAGRQHKEVEEKDLPIWEKATNAGWSTLGVNLHKQFDLMIKQRWPVPTATPGADHPMPSNAIAWADALDHELETLEQKYRKQDSKNDNDTTGHLAVARFLQKMNEEPKDKRFSDYLSKAGPPSKRECEKRIIQYLQEQQKHMPSKRVRAEWGTAFLFVIGWFCFTLLGLSMAAFSWLVGIALVVLLVNLSEYYWHVRTKMFEPRHHLQHFYRFMLVSHCERYENKQRLAVVHALRERLAGLTSTTLSQVREQLEDEAKASLLAIFKDNLAAQRNVFAINKGIFISSAGNGTGLSSTALSKNVGYMQAEEMFHEITRERDSGYWKGGEMCLHHSFEGSKTLAEQHQSDSWQKIFRASLFNYTHSVIKKRVTDVDFKINLDLPELWRTIVSRVRRPLCKLQEGRKPSSVFLCRNHSYIYTTFNPQLTRDDLGEMEFVTIADNRQIDEGESTEYLLVAACYAMQTPLNKGSSMQDMPQQGNR